MDTNADRGLDAAPLLVRRAGPAAVPDVAALLRDVPVGAGEVAALVRRRAVLVLSNVTLPPSAPPVAAAAFRPDLTARTAQLVGIAVAEPVRGRGLGHRLLTGALMLLRAEGFGQVQAWAEPGGAAAALLASAGFAADGDAVRPDGRARFLLPL